MKWSRARVYVVHGLGLLLTANVGAALVRHLYNPLRGYDEEVEEMRAEVIAEWQAGKAAFKYYKRREPPPSLAAVADFHSPLLREKDLTTLEVPEGLGFRPFGNQFPKHHRSGSRTPSPTELPLFRQAFKYYKRREPPPSLAAVADFHSPLLREKDLTTLEVPEGLGFRPFGNQFPKHHRSGSRTPSPTELPLFRQAFKYYKRREPPPSLAAVADFHSPLLREKDLTTLEVPEGLGFRPFGNQFPKHHRSGSRTPSPTELPLFRQAFKYYKRREPPPSLAAVADFHSPLLREKDLTTLEVPEGLGFRPFGNQFPKHHRSGSRTPSPTELPLFRQAFKYYKRREPPPSLAAVADFHSPLLREKDLTTLEVPEGLGFRPFGNQFPKHHRSGSRTPSPTELPLFRQAFKYYKRREPPPSLAAVADFHSPLLREKDLTTLEVPEGLGFRPFGNQFPKHHRSGSRTPSPTELPLFRQAFKYYKRREPPPSLAAVADFHSPLLREKDLTTLEVPEGLGFRPFGNQFPKHHRSGSRTPSPTELPLFRQAFKYYKRREPPPSLAAVADFHSPLLREKDLTTLEVPEGLGFRPFGNQFPKHHRSGSRTPSPTELPLFRQAFKYYKRREPPPSLAAVADFHSPLLREKDLTTLEVPEGLGFRPFGNQFPKHHRSGSRTPSPTELPLFRQAFKYYKRREPPPSLAAVADFHSPLLREKDLTTLEVPEGLGFRPFGNQFPKHHRSGSRTPSPTELPLFRQAFKYYKRREPPPSLAAVADFHSPLLREKDLTTLEVPEGLGFRPFGNQFPKHHRSGSRTPSPTELPLFRQAFKYYKRREPPPSLAAVADFHSPLLREKDLTTLEVPEGLGFRPFGNQFPKHHRSGSRTPSPTELPLFRQAFKYYKRREPPPSLAAVADFHSPLLREKDLTTLEVPEGLGFRPFGNQFPKHHRSGSRTPSPTELPLFRQAFKYYKRREPPPSLAAVADFHSPLLREKDLTTLEVPEGLGFRPFGNQFPKHHRSGSRTPSPTELPLFRQAFKYYKRREPPPSLAAVADFHSPLLREKDLTTLEVPEGLGFRPFGNQFPKHHRSGSRTPSPTELPLFRQAFKYYKRREPPPSLAAVADFHSPLLREKDLTTLEVPEGLGFRPFGNWKAYTVEGRHGLYLGTGIFTTTGQLEWMSRAIRDYPVSPNVTNLDKFLPMERRGQPFQDDLDRLAKLRWTTLGYHYDWDAKVYKEEARTEFPTELGKVSETIATAFGFPQFKAEAGIVNYYPPKATLSGHVDSSEWSLEPPLVSLSFGQTAVYLQGGPTLDEEPLALYLRSGDVLIMHGPQRTVYHGVPLILTDTAWSESEDSALLAYANKFRVNFTIRQMK